MVFLASALSADEPISIFRLRKCGIVRSDDCAYPKTVSDCSETRPGTAYANFDRLLRKDARRQDATQSRETRSTTGASTIDRGDSQYTVANRVSGTLHALPKDMLGHRRSCDCCSKGVMTLRTLYRQHRGSNTLQRRLRSILHLLCSFGHALYQK